MLINWMNKLMPFYEGDGGGAGAGAGAGDGAGAGAGAGAGEQNKGGGDKTYSQKEVNAIAKREKGSGRNALLKELFGEKDDYTADLTNYKTSAEASKTAAEKQNEAVKNAEAKAAKAEREKQILEHSLNLIKAGVKPAYVDDMVLIVLAKVNDENDFETVVEGLKKTYPEQFGEEEEDGENKGTGSAGNPKRKQSKKTTTVGLGKRLGESNKPAAKSSYFD